MGCELTKLTSSDLQEQDPLERAPPPADPRSPLTAKEQYCILASWKGIFREIEKTGILLFVKLFEENEDILDLFEKFESLRTREEQTNSMELAEHATKVMQTLSEGIKTLGDVDSFFAFIHHVGATHRRIDGFKADNFWKVEQPFLEAAKTTLGERYSANIERIYKITIKFIIQNLVQGYVEGEEGLGPAPTVQKS